MSLGLEVYATKTEGIGGVIKESVDDFVVEEVLVDGSKASVCGAVPSKVLGSTSSRQRYLLCVLVKRNWDTMIAVKNIAKALGIDQARVEYAGIKDAKAVTAQHITLDNVAMEEVANLNIKDINVYPVGYVREMLSLFYLLGNSFTITIKSEDASPANVGKRIDQVKQELDALGGIPNFFGHQRFGTTRPITHLVGKALVRGDFKEAAMLFLAKPSPFEHPSSRQARQELRLTGDFKQALVDYPRQLRFEHLMLQHLAEQTEDFAGAFKRLPPRLQMLFVQAHQSYLFNRFLSERIKHGLPLNEALVGDFVVAVERSGLPLTTISKTVTAANLDEVNFQVKAGKLRVALPILGVKQKLSDCSMGEIESRVLKQEGVESVSMRGNALSRVGGKGGLRTTLAPIRDFKVQSTTKHQIKLCFMLLRGCYATVLLREIMKPKDPIAAGF